MTVTVSLFGMMVAVTANPLSLGPNGTQRELFIDGHMIEKMTGDVRQLLQEPEPKEVVLTTNAPWEVTPVPITRFFAMVLCFGCTTEVRIGTPPQKRPHTGKSLVTQRAVTG